MEVQGADCKLKEDVVGREPSANAVAAAMVPPVIHQIKNSQTHAYKTPSAQFQLPNAFKKLGRQQIRECAREN